MSIKQLRQKLIVWFIVILIGLMAAIINIAHVIANFLRTPAGYFYTGTGHYYLDYFLYLQPVGAGSRGHWLPVNYVNSSDQFIYLFRFPYIIIGQIGRLFNLTPPAAYWLSVFLMTIVVILFIYHIIGLILKNNPLAKLAGLLITIFSSPFFFLKNNSKEWQVFVYDFWYGPGVFLRRFGLVPHHLLATLLTLIIIIVGVSLIEKIYIDKLKTVIVKMLLIDVLLLIITIISPISAVIPLITISIIYCIYLARNVNQNTQLRSFFLFYLYIFFIGIFVFPVSLIIRNYYQQSNILAQLRAGDIAWNQFDSINFLVLNIGWVILFIPFAIKRVVGNKNPAIWILFLSTILSYIFYYSPIAIFFGTHNLRFFSLTNYITFGILTIWGIETIAELLHLKKRNLIILMTTVLMVIFSIPNLNTLKFRLRNQDDRVPQVPISYLPNDLKEGFSFLNKETDHGSVLTDSYNYMGMVLPVYVERKSFIGEPIYTSEFYQKQEQVDLLLKGKMNPSEASELLKKNQIKYIFLTSIDAYSGTELLRYNFLKKIFKNVSVQIYKVN